MLYSIKFEKKKHKLFKCGFEVKRSKYTSKNKITFEMSLVTTKKTKFSNF